MVAVDDLLSDEAIERAAERLWFEVEYRDPSGPLTGCTAEDQRRDPLPWSQAGWATKRDLRADALAVLRAVLGEE